MKELKPKESPQRQRREKVLPLVLEILPGQASHGLIDIYEPGSYEGKSLRKLCDHTLAKPNWSIEDRQIVDDILRQLDGGILLCRGQDVYDQALTYAEVEESEAGEKYLYVPIRVIKPQEGGAGAKEPKGGMRFAFPPYGLRSYGLHWCVERTLRKTFRSSCS